MVDVNDTNSTRRKLQNAWNNLGEADIDDRDREAIREFVEYRRDVEERAPNTLISDLGNLRRSSERADTPLVDMTMPDVRALFVRLTAPKDPDDPTREPGYGIDGDSTTMFGYERCLRLLFKFRDEHREDDRYTFWEDIELTDIELGQGYDRDELLTEAEIAELKSNTRNERDRAIIDFLADVGARISLATSLRVGDVEGIETKTPQFTPNESALNLKNVEMKEYPILHARGELRSWLNINHPEAPDPHDDAPLFPVRDGYDSEDRQQMAASNDAIRDRLRAARDRAGIDKPVRPHAFRHVTLTRIANSGLDDRDLEHAAMLADLRMIKEVYDHTTGEERNLRIQQSAGFVEDAEVDRENEVATIACPNCRNPVKTTDHYCSACASEVTEAAREETGDRKETLVFDMTDIEDPDVRGAVATLHERLGVDPAAGHDSSSS